MNCNENERESETTRAHENENETETASKKVKGNQNACIQSCVVPFPSNPNPGGITQDSQKLYKSCN